LFGPAYKGIPLATATVIALADHHGGNVPYAFNRKEAKDHGEGGSIVGTALQGRVVIVDDVISDGAAKREAIDLIRRAGATPTTVLLALDRQERGQGERSAVQELQAAHGVSCVSILTLGQLLAALENPPDGRARVSAQQLTALKAYRAQFGVS
jgi:orotate phosphoribosyltransferase